MLVAALISNPIDTYSATVSDSGFGSPINHYVGSNNNDQPWIRTGPSNHVYVAFNDLGRFKPPGDGKTASVNVSTDGGANYTTVLDRVGADAGQDDAAVRLAVNGSRVYAVFDRWTSQVEGGASGFRSNSQLVVVRSDNGGADGFTALGTGGNGVTAATHIALFADTKNTELIIGQERIVGGDLAIAVDPNDANHVVVVYTDAPGRRAWPYSQAAPSDCSTTVMPPRWAIPRRTRCLSTCGRRPMISRPPTTSRSPAEATSPLRSYSIPTSATSSISAASGIRSTASSALRTPMTARTRSSPVADDTPARMSRGRRTRAPASSNSGSGAGVRCA